MCRENGLLLKLLRGQLPLLLSLCRLLRDELAAVLRGGGSRQQHLLPLPARLLRGREEALSDHRELLLLMLVLQLLHRVDRLAGAADTRLGRLESGRTTGPGNADGRASRRLGRLQFTRPGHSRLGCRRPGRQ